MNLSAINLNLLISLKALLDEGNVTRAARLLNITQSGMSKNLAQLREMFNDPLLVRAGNTLVLTEKATALRSQLHSVLAGLDLLLSGERFSPTTCNRRFRIAVTDYVAEYILPDVLKTLVKEAPLLSVDIDIWKQGDVDRLADGTLDLASSIVDSAMEDLHHIRIGTDSFVCCMRAENPLAKSLSLESYSAADHAAVTSGGDKIRIIDAELSHLGKRRTVRFSAPLYGPVFEMMRRSDLVLTLPSHIAANLTAKYGLIIRPLPFPTRSFDYSVIWHKRQHFDASHQWFRKRLQEEIAQSHFSHQPPEGIPSK